MLMLFEDLANVVAKGKENNSDSASSGERKQISPNYRN